jgi:hypothetical protein
MKWSRYCVHGFGPHLKPRGLEIRRSDHGGFVIPTGSFHVWKPRGISCCEETALFCQLQSKLRKFAISCKPEVYPKETPRGSRGFRSKHGQNCAHWPVNLFWTGYDSAGFTTCYTIICTWLHGGIAIKAIDCECGSRIAAAQCTVQPQPHLVMTSLTTHKEGPRVSKHSSGFLCCLILMANGVS